MNLLTRLEHLVARLFGVRKALKPGAALPRSGDGWSAPYGLSDSQGDPALMMREFRGWVYKAVNRRAQDVAAAHRRIQRERTNEEYTDLPHTHPLYNLMRSPNPTQTGHELLWLAHVHADLTGNAYIVKLPNSFGLPAELWVLDPRYITIIPGEHGGIQRYEYRTGTKKWSIGPEYMMHFKYPNPSDPYYGASPLLAAAYEVDIDNASKRHQKAFLANNPTPRYAIEAEGHLLPATVEDLRDQLRKQHTDLKAGVPLILHQGAKAHALDIQPQEVNYIETRKLIRDEIVTVYGVPASVLGISEDVNRANAEANHFTYALYTLEPLARMWDELLTRALAREFGNDIRITHDTLVPRNREEDRADTEMLLRNGVVSINEERTYRGWPSIPGGDVPTVESGRTRLSDIQQPQSQGKTYMDALEDLRERIITIINALPCGRDELKQVVESELRGASLPGKNILSPLQTLLLRVLGDASSPDEGLDAIADVWDSEILPLVQSSLKEAA